MAGSPPNLHTMVPSIGRIEGVCAEGQGQSQRSRDTGTSLMSRNVCYTVPSDVLSLHALTFLRSTITLSFWCKCQAARCNVTPAFALRKFFKESLTHGPLNLCVNEKTVRVNDSPYFQFRSHTVPPPIPMPILKC